MTNALVVADDLTGALDTAHGFAVRGHGAYARLADEGATLSTDADVLAVDTDSRDADSTVAARAVRQIVAGIDAATIYKKIDSTLRGNVVPEVDAALATSDASLAVVAPAFPGTGRTTRDGVHHVDGTPLAEASYGVTESSLPRFFAASDYPVEHLPLSVVRSGSEAVAGTLGEHVDPADGGPIVVVCDATTGADLAELAAGADALDTNPLFVGSGGLAEHVAVPGEPAGVSEPAHDGTGVLGVVGSVNPRTLDQLAAIPDEEVVRIDPREAVRSPRETATTAIPGLVRRLRERDRAVVTAAVDASDVGRARRVAEEVAGPGESVDVGKRVARSLAAAAASVETERETALGGLVLTGGDIARATLDALGATGVSLTGEAVDDGMPIERLADGPAAGTLVVTKAGGFGDRRSIVRSLERVGETDE
jgi:uncharacterized protein YgbK (DUF1537 family)